MELAEVGDGVWVNTKMVVNVIEWSNDLTEVRLSDGTRYRLDMSMEAVVLLLSGTRASDCRTFRDFTKPGE